MNKLHIPTAQFGFLETEFEGTPDEAVAEYRRLEKLINGMEGMPRKEFMAILDSVLSTGKRPMSADEWESMSPEQQNILGEIKASWKRTGFDLAWLVERRDKTIN